MLQRQYRFHGHGSLRYLYAKGRSVRNRALQIRFAHNINRSDSRLAVIVTRKVVKPAPGRNRIRRRIYELMRGHWNDLEPGYDMLVTVYEPHFATMPAAELEGLLVDGLRQAKLLKPRD